MGAALRDAGQAFLQATIDDPKTDPDLCRVADGMAADFVVPSWGQVAPAVPQAGMPTAPSSVWPL